MQPFAIALVALSASVITAFTPTFDPNPCDYAIGASCPLEIVEWRYQCCKDGTYKFCTIDERIIAIATCQQGSGCVPGLYTCDPNFGCDLDSSPPPLPCH
jgi:hypothetical protein